MRTGSLAEKSHAITCCVRVRLWAGAHGIVEQALYGVSFAVHTNLEQLQNMDVA